MDILKIDPAPFLWLRITLNPQGQLEARFIVRFRENGELACPSQVLLDGYM